MALRRCCCCVPLRAGVLVLAIVNTVLHVGTLLAWALFTIYSIFCVPADEYRESPEYFGRRSRLWLHVLLTLACLCAVHVTADCLLLVAVRRGRRRLMLPWLLWQAVFTSGAMLLWLAGVGYLLWLLLTSGGALRSLLLLALSTAAAGGLLLFAVLWYWFACVLAYYVQLAPGDRYLLEPLRLRSAAHGDVIASSYMQMAAG